MSHKLAQLFNASYDFGGAKLLDYLQTSIGLTESDIWYYIILTTIIFQSVMEKSTHIEIILSQVSMAPRRIVLQLKTQLHTFLPPLLFLRIGRAHLNWQSLAFSGFLFIWFMIRNLLASILVILYCISIPTFSLLYAFSVFCLIVYLRIQ